MQDREKTQHEDMDPPLDDVRGADDDGLTTDASAAVADETPLVNGETKPNDGSGGHPYDDRSPEGAAIVEDDERNEKRATTRSKPPTKLRFMNSSRQVGGSGKGLYPGRPAGPMWQPQHSWQHYMQNQQRLGYMTQYSPYASANPYVWRSMAQPAGASTVSSMYPVIRQSHHQPQQHQHYQQSHQQQPEQLSATNVYIRALNPTTTDQDLQDMCKEFGEISSVKAIINKNTGDCKGYGFVDFASAEDAKKALEQLKARKIQAQFAKLTPNDPRWKRQQETDPTNLYIQNLPKYLDEKGLESLLAPFGKVVSTRILKEQGSSFSKGVGFARMSAQNECEAVINKFNGSLIPGSEVPLVCKFADAASSRRKYHPDQRRLSGDAELGAQDAIMSSRLSGGQARPLQTAVMSSYVQGMHQGPYQLASGQANWIQSPQGYVSVQSAIPTSSVTVQSPQDSLTASYSQAMVPQLAAQMQQLQLSQTLSQQQPPHQNQSVYMTVSNPPAGTAYAHHHHHHHQQQQHHHQHTTAVQHPQHHHTQWPVAAQPHGSLVHIPSVEDSIGLIHATTSDTSPQHGDHHLSHPAAMMQQAAVSPTDSPAAAVSQIFVDDPSMGHLSMQPYSFNTSGQMAQHTAWPAS
eukprot:m.167362 g.167362  ORF g.167362 m.167362 type:complete len:633 (+) comp38929_c1_seq25:323-2221(+)